MRRATLTSLAIVAAFLLPLGSPAAPAFGAVADAHVTVQFKLPAGHGLTARLESFKDRINLQIRGRHRWVDYSVLGEVSEQGVEARFEGLGRIQVTFQPTRTLESNEPPAECEGDPWTTKAGVFSGVIEFTGPHGYASIDRASARGTVRVTPDWSCDHQGPHAVVVQGSTAPATEEEGDEATLTAIDNGRRRFFVALAIRDPDYPDYTAFYGGTTRRQGEMRVVSAGFIATRPQPFSFDHELGVATVSPPLPFSGAASFRRGVSAASSSWTGSLRVSLLDSARPVALTGRDFRVRLERDFPGD